MEKIEEVKAFQVLDSRGNPTLKVVVKTKKASGFAIVPSGISTGSYEAVELRDNKKEYHGKGVQRAVNNVNKRISKAVKGLMVTDQEAVDMAMKKLDNTPNKSSIGANAMLGVSLAVSRAAAELKNKQLYEYIAEIYGNKNQLMLPVPLANVINGGAHAGNYLKFQEFMLIPLRARSFAEAARMVSETYHTLKKIIDDKYGKNATNVGDEGGFAPPLRTAEEALDIMKEAIIKSGYRRKISIGFDVAASNIYHDKTYDVGVSFSSSGLTQYYDRLISKYDGRSIEDGFDQDDTEAWAEFMQTVAKRRKIQVVGDDLIVTNPDRVKMAVSHNLCNAMIIKVNQIGTLTEALSAARIASAVGWQIIVSHRSGDTEDSYIADLAVGIGASQIKLGAPCRGERTAKYNRLIEIEDGLKKKIYAGKKLRL